MVLKKGKGYQVKNLKTINLIEADFNFNNKVIVKIIVEYVDYNYYVPKEE